jgi:sugar phosphate isomerase/epimerase
LTHVHISGNHGKHDEHLTISKGNINWNLMLSAVKKAGYDGTISLEVFTSPKERLSDKPKLRKIWDSLQ